MNSADSPLQHLQALQALLEELQPHGIALHSHEYTAAGFATFAIVLGMGHKRARFSWDGKESLLTVWYQLAPNEGAAGTWQHDAYISVAPQDGVFSEIASNAVAMLE